MKFPNFVGPAYTGQSKNATVDELINMFVERIEVPGSGKNEYVLYKRPGYLLVTDTATPVILQCPTPDPVVNEPYEFQMVAVGGTGPYIWFLIAGAFPDGIILNQNGLISGTATQDGTFSFTIQVIDSVGVTATIDCEFDIAAPPAPIILECPTPNPVINEPYEFQMTVIGGIAPYTWSLTGGALPTGLTMDSDGLISGTPTMAGDFTFEITVTDGDANTASDECELVVLSAQTCFRFLNEEEYEDDPPVNPERSFILNGELTIDEDGECGTSNTENDITVKSSTVAAYQATQHQWALPEPDPGLISLTIGVRYRVWQAIPEIGAGPVVRIDIHNARTNLAPGDAGYADTLVDSLVFNVSYTADLDYTNVTKTYTAAELVTNFGADWWNNIYLNERLWIPALMVSFGVTNVNIDSVVKDGSNANYYWSGRTGPYPQIDSHVTITGCSNSGNNGTFKITFSNGSPDFFTVVNPSAVDEDPSDGVAVTDPWWHLYVSDTWGLFSY